MRNERTAPTVPETDTQWRTNSFEGTLTNIYVGAPIIGVVLIVVAFLSKQSWLFVASGALFGIAIQVWIVLCVFHAWRHESRHQTAALIEAHTAV